MAAIKKADKDETKAGSTHSLREDAEKRLAQSQKIPFSRHGQTADELIHELRVHQIELEMQAEDLRKSKIALEESRDNYLDLYEFAPLGYLTLNHEALIMEVNLTGATLLGVERSKLVKARFRKFVAQKDNEQWIQYFVNVLNHEEKQCCSLMINRGDGSAFPARLEGVRLTGSSRATTVRIALIDITDIWQIEALKESEEKYRNVVEDQTEFICRFLPDGTHIFVNDAYCRYFNKKQEEIIRHRFRPLLHPEDREIVARHLASLTPQNPVMNIDQRIIMPDGSTRWQRWSDRAIFGENGRIIEYQSVGRDITDTKEAEAAIRQANRKLTLLTSITRHDITNQLTVLRGYLNRIAKQHPDPSFSSYLHKSITASERISAMIRFTREYEAIGVNAPVWQDCRTLVDTAAKQVPLGKIVLKNDLPAGMTIFADPLITRVFYNLMDNAVRYGQKITTIRFSVQESGDDSLIVCEDAGDGVPVDEKEKIFERGFGRNTGLGLALSREILSITGITIKETGEPGTGARFEMTVPKEAYRLGGVQ